MLSQPSSGKEEAVASRWRDSDWLLEREARASAMVSEGQAVTLAEPAPGTGTMMPCFRGRSNEANAHRFPAYREADCEPNAFRTYETE